MLTFDNKEKKIIEVNSSFNLGKLDEELRILTFDNGYTFTHYNTTLLYKLNKGNLEGVYLYDINKFSKFPLFLIQKNEIIYIRVIRNEIYTGDFKPDKFKVVFHRKYLELIKKNEYLLIG